MVLSKGVGGNCCCSTVFPYSLVTLAFFLLSCPLLRQGWVGSDSICDLKQAEELAGCGGGWVGVG